MRQRPEQIAYYERHGYRKSGKTLPFPSHKQVGRPKDPDLELIEMVFTLGEIVAGNRYQANLFRLTSRQGICLKVDLEFRSE